MLGSFLLKMQLLRALHFSSTTFQTTKNPSQKYKKNPKILKKPIFIRLKKCLELSNINFGGISVNAKLIQL